MLSILEDFHSQTIQNWGQEHSLPKVHIIKSSQVYYMVIQAIFFNMLHKLVKKTIFGMNIYIFPITNIQKFQPLIHIPKRKLTVLSTCFNLECYIQYPISEMTSKGSLTYQKLKIQHKCQKKKGKEDFLVRKTNKKLSLDLHLVRVQHSEVQSLNRIYKGRCYVYAQSGGKLVAQN